MALSDLRAGAGSGYSRTVLAMAGIFVASAMVAILPLQEGEAGDGLLRLPGYTASLALGMFPLLPLLWWLRQGGNGRRVTRRAFGYTAAIVVPFWTILDVLLAHTFFTFPKAAETTLGLNIPGLHPIDGWGWNIPIEELAFYLLSCLTMVLLYAWSSERWFSAYDETPMTYQRHAARCIRNIRPDGRKIAYVAALFMAVYAFKKLGAHDHHEGFPGYALVLLLGALLPNYTVYPAISRFINKQAMLFTMMAVVLLSLLWEVTLGLPKEWWGYRPEMMMGVFIQPWSGLPLEAFFLWMMAGWGNVVLFEFFRMKIYSGRPGRELLCAQAPFDSGPPAAAVAQGGPPARPGPQTTQGPPA